MFPYVDNPDNKRLDLVYEFDEIIADVTIAQHHANNGSFEKAEKAKAVKYQRVCEEHGYDFETYALNPFGGMSQDLMGFFKRCQSRIDRTDPNWSDRNPTTWAAPDFSTFWKQRLSCSVIKRYAEMIERKARLSIRDGSAKLKAQGQNPPLAEPTQTVDGTATRVLTPNIHSSNITNFGADPAPLPRVLHFATGNSPTRRDQTGLPATAPPPNEGNSIPKTSKRRDSKIPSSSQPLNTTRQTPPPSARSTSRTSKTTSPTDTRRQPNPTLATVSHDLTIKHPKPAAPATPRVPSTNFTTTATNRTPLLALPPHFTPNTLTQRRPDPQTADPATPSPLNLTADTIDTTDFRFAAGLDTPNQPRYASDDSDNSPIVRSHSAARRGTRGQ